MNTRECVAQRIMELCREKDLSFHALGIQSGVPSSTVKSILNGASKNPGIVTLKMLCDGLGITLCDFFDTEEFRDLEQELR